MTDSKRVYQQDICFLGNTYPCKRHSLGSGHGPYESHPRPMALYSATLKDRGGNERRNAYTLKCNGWLYRLSIASVDLDPCLLELFCLLQAGSMLDRAVNDLKSTCHKKHRETSHSISSYQSRIFTQALCSVLAVTVALDCQAENKEMRAYPLLQCHVTWPRFMRCMSSQNEYADPILLSDKRQGC